MTNYEMVYGKKSEKPKHHSYDTPVYPETVHNVYNSEQGTGGGLNENNKVVNEGINLIKKGVSNLSDKVKDYKDSEDSKNKLVKVRRVSSNEKNNVRNISEIIIDSASEINNNLENKLSETTIDNTHLDDTKKTVEYVTEVSDDYSWEANNIISSNMNLDLESSEIQISPAVSNKKTYSEEDNNESEDNDNLNSYVSVIASDVVPFMILMILMICVGPILLFLSNNNLKKNSEQMLDNGNKAGKHTTSVVSETSNTSEQIDETDEIKAEKEMVSVVTEMIDIPSVNLYSDDDLKSAAKKAMDKFNYLGTDDGYIPGSLFYTLDYDLNGDGVPELIDSYAPLTDSAFEIYYYNGSSFIEAYKGLGYLNICSDKHYFSVSVYGGGIRYSVFEYTAENQAVLIDQLAYSDLRYYRGELNVTEDSYNSAKSLYDNLNWIPIENALSKSSAQETPSTAANKIKKVYTSENLNLYDTMITGYVRTNGDVLNMRNGPGTTYDIISEIPNGTSLIIHGEESGWYYIYYNYMYGFVSKDWVGY